MFELKKLYFLKMNLLMSKGLKDGKIIPFNDKFYEKLSHTYISGIPVSFHIKYLKPNYSPGKCYDRSLYMFFCFDDAILVRGDNKDLELAYGSENAGHGWIELDNYVYDPSLMMRFDKDLYYKMFKPTNIYKCDKEKYCQNKDNKKFYEDIKNTSIEDYKYNNKKRIELLTVIPLLQGIISNTHNEDFKSDLNIWLEKISYDEEKIYDDIGKEFKLF